MHRSKHARSLIPLPTNGGIPAGWPSGVGGRTVLRPLSSAAGLSPGVVVEDGPVEDEVVLAALAKE
eukprot:CAMPEP_0168399008 /NCGR_PEP_ID=MMETSP0228-20121227/21871_1 /TAXON_ID=133427 /ORGANISM="Protoceratium reticulatum, Strain CCCM 535 (=CCMP 1889)" /LENGTH=65 /DNA_ID=CAMNT_0008412525 /DNA_START=1 /DNA_END=198 /DNA_ORIENTATION=+